MLKNTSQSVYIALFIWSLMHAFAAFPHCQHLSVTARIQLLPNVANEICTLPCQKIAALLRLRLFIS
jgi:hypothetical protein